MYKKLFLIFFISQLDFVFAQTESNVQNDFTKTPKLAWKYTVNEPFFSSPVIADNIIFLGGSDSIFRALDLESGNILWEFKTKGPIRSTALFENDKIYFNGGDGILYCLNKNGNQVWSSSIGEEKQYDFADYHQSSPVIFEGIIFIGSGDGLICAVNSEDGKLKWKYQTGGVVHSTPAVDSDKVYAGSFDGNIYALNISDGSLAWKFKTAGHRYFPLGEVQGSPAQNSDAVFIGARDYNVYALDKDKGYCHWNKAFTNGWVLSNTFKDSLLYIAGADERIFASIYPESGKEKWINKMEFLMFGKPAFSKTMLYIGTTIGKLHGINTETGEIIWTFSTDGYMNNKNKYFKEDDSYRDDIYSIIKSNEQFLEVELELDGIFSTPAIYNDYLVFTTGGGSVYCLRIQ